MKTRYTVALSVLAGAVLGAILSQEHQAQAKPPAFVVEDIDISNRQAFVKEFVRLGTKALATGSGFKTLARGNKTVSIEGAAPKFVAINHFDNLDEAIKAYNSLEYKEAR